MPLVKLREADLWSMDPGIEASGDALGLSVGGGGWSSYSIEGYELPQPPWTSLGGQEASIVDGKILRILDTSGTDFRTFRLFPPYWSADFTSGGGASFHIRVFAVNNTSSFLGACVEAIDGSTKFVFKFLGDGRIRLEGLQEMEFLSSQAYPWKELFVSIQAGHLNLWIWNERARAWELMGSGIAGVQKPQCLLSLGSISDSDYGDSYWDFLRFKEEGVSVPLTPMSPVAEMGQVDVRAEVEQVPIIEETGTGGSIEYQYDLGQGWNGAWMDLAMLEASLLGQRPDTLNIKARFVSNGLGKATLELGGGVICGSGIGSSYNLPLSAIELDGEEVIEL